MTDSCTGLYAGCECADCDAEARATHAAEAWAEGAWLRAAEAGEDTGENCPERIQARQAARDAERLYADDSGQPF